MQNIAKNLRKCPPPAIYDIEVAYFQINEHEHRIAIVLQLIQGPHKGFQFLERYHLADPLYGQILQQLERLTDTEPKKTTAAYLRHRYVNGVKTLGIKRLGWR
jgi:hypothetical protein